MFVPCISNLSDLLRAFTYICMQPSRFTDQYTNKFIQAPWIYQWVYPRIRPWDTSMDTSLDIENSKDISMDIYTCMYACPGIYPCIYPCPYPWSYLRHPLTNRGAQAKPDRAHCPELPRFLPNQAPWDLSTMITRQVGSTENIGTGSYPSTHTHEVGAKWKSGCNSRSMDVVDMR